MSTLDRQDLGPEANEARRKFWEMCASQAVTALGNEEFYSQFHDHEKFYDRPECAAKWADYMLDEWDKRWIARETETSQEGKTVLPFSIPNLVNKEAPNHFEYSRMVFRLV